MTATALLLTHRGSPSTARLVQTLREKGFQPCVFSSATFDDGAAFRKLCGELGVEHAIGRGVSAEAADVMQALPLDGCRFAFAVWDGQRPLMAALNQRLGAPDVPPEAIRLAQDKLACRAALRRHGLTRLDAAKLDDAGLRARLHRGEKHIVKPRRGSGSLFTAAVSSLAEATALAEAFARGPSGQDLFAEFFAGNELLAETFFDGRELSIELVRQGGRTVLRCEHEKTILEFTGSTVLERGLASPAVMLSAREIEIATARTEAALAALGLGEGCYHVELRVATDGECEIIEVNPRIGGGYIADSVRLQLGRYMVHDWIDLLAGKTLDGAAADRHCGTYFQLSYPEVGRQIVALHKDAGLPAPELFVEVARPGAIARSDREDIGAMTLWRTGLRTHRDEVAALAGREYVSFEYAAGSP